MTDLFGAPDPPTGPATDVDEKFGQESDRFERYQEWKRTPEGKRACLAIAGLAFAEKKRGAIRISTKFLVETVRRTERVTITNTWTAWIADDLVAKYPEFLPLIERRARSKPKE